MTDSHAPVLDENPVRLRRCRHGWMAYLTTDQYIGRSLDLYGEFSEAEVDLFQQLLQPGQTVLELGANLGAHTLALAEAVGPRGRVIAAEPQRIIFQLLCANAALNRIPNIDARQTAAGRQSGAILVPHIDYSRDANFGGVGLGKWSAGESVPLTPVDEWNLPACHLIKVDVEGMELDAITGATETIDRLRPALYVENDREESSAALIEMLLGMDYRLYWHLPPLFNPNNFFGNSENVFGQIVSANMLCLPAATTQNIQGLREIKSPEDTWNS